VTDVVYMNQNPEPQWEPVVGRAPMRVVLENKKGWRRPITAKDVSRQGVHGNPFKVGRYVLASSPLWMSMPLEIRRFRTDGYFIDTPELAVECFRIYLEEHPAFKRKGIEALRGFDVMCHCPLDQPCHGDVWLEIANA